MVFKAKVHSLIVNEKKKKRNITLSSFTFAFYVVNILLCFSYHHQNFRAHATSIQKIMIVAVDAYKHIKLPLITK